MKQPKEQSLTKKQKDQQLDELRSWMEDCQFEHSRVGAHGGKCAVSEKGAKRCVAIVVTDMEQRLSALEMNRKSR